MMKIRLFFLLPLLVPILLLTGAFVLRSNSLSPEQMLIGNWKEVSWTYEKADAAGALDFDKESINDAIKHMISRSKIIHQAERWKFTADSGLLLNAHNKYMKIDWALMGRGNILRLKYNNRFEEHYELMELDNKHMVLHFENDQLTRGIVKITFEKI